MYARVSTALLLSVLLTPGCEPQSDSGTNTNWLRQCQKGSECDPTDACLCGRCTVQCRTNDDCPSGHACTSFLAATLQCGGEPTSTCQPLCSTSDECEGDRFCHHGTCVDALPTLVCTTNELFCEDFETELDAAYVSAITDGNSVELVSRGAPSGDTSLLSSVSAAPSTSYLRAEIDAPDSGQIFLSGWVRVPETLPHDAAPLALWSSAEESWALRLTLRDAGVEVWSETTPMTMRHELEPSTWHCLELGITLGDEPNGVVELFIDGQLMETATGVDTLPEGGIEAVAWGNLWAGSASDVEVDRIVVSTTPSHCFD